MADEKPLKPPKGFRSFKKWTAEVGERIHRSRVLPGPGFQVNEMPDGRQGIAKGGDSASGAAIEIAMAVWPGPVSKLVRVEAFGQRDVPESA